MNPDQPWHPDDLTDEFGRWPRWDCPAGAHTATLEAALLKVKETSGGMVLRVRLVFRIEALSDARQRLLVGRTYLLDLNPGTELRNLLDGWLGADFVQDFLCGPQGSFDLLIGCDADLMIVCKPWRGHPDFAEIVSAHPPGTITGGGAMKSGGGHPE